MTLKERANHLAKRLVAGKLVKLDYETYHKRITPMIENQFKAVLKETAEAWEQEENVWNVSDWIRARAKGGA